MPNTMYSSNKWLLTLFLLPGFIISSYGQDRSTGTATVTVVTPIGVTNNTDSTSGSNNGTVILTPVIQSNLSGNSNTSTSGNEISASYTVKDQGAYTYSITLPATVNSGNAVLVVSSSISTTPGKEASGKSIETLNVGVAFKNAGDKFGGIIIPITVNYN
jgi:hypothetical protein